MTLILLIPAIVVLCFGAWKAALIVLGVGVLLDFVIAMLRVGARATLEDGVFGLRVLAGPVKLTLLPKAEKEKEAEEEEEEEEGEEKPKKKPQKKPKKPKMAKQTKLAKKEKKAKKKKAEAEAGEEEKREKKERTVKVDMELVSTVLSALGELLGRLRRKISIDKLTVHYTVAAEDPASAAMTFGYASAGINALMPAVENIFKVKDRDVGVAVTFDKTEGDIYVDAQLTLAVWEIFYIVFAVWPVVKNIVRQFLNKRKVDTNGQSSDQ